MSIEREFVEAVADENLFNFARERFDVTSSAKRYSAICIETARKILKIAQVPDLPRCKTCKSWDGGVQTRLSGEACCGRTADGRRSADGATSASPVSCAAKGYAIYPGPEFGCVHYEKREGKPQYPYDIPKLLAVAEAALRVTRDGFGYLALNEALNAAGYTDASQPRL